MCSEKERQKSSNEVAYLAVPTLVSSLLTIFSTLSTPMIRGMSVAVIKPGGAEGRGLVRFGSSGWCVCGVKSVECEGLYQYLLSSFYPPHCDLGDNESGVSN